MAWLRQLLYLQPDPDEPETAELTITLAAEVDDGFGGKIVSLKHISAAEAVSQGIDLPLNLRGINLSLAAARDKAEREAKRLNGELASAVDALDSAEAERDALKVQAAEHSRELQEAASQGREGMVRLEAELAGERETIADLRATVASLSYDITVLRSSGPSL